MQPHNHFAAGDILHLPFSPAHLQSIPEPKASAQAGARLPGKELLSALRLHGLTALRKMKEDPISLFHSLITAQHQRKRQEVGLRPGRAVVSVHALQASARPASLEPQLLEGNIPGFWSEPSARARPKEEYSQ